MNIFEQLVEELKEENLLEQADRQEGEQENGNKQHFNGATNGHDAFESVFSTDEIEEEIKNEISPKVFENGFVDENAADTPSFEESQFAESPQTEESAEEEAAEDSENIPAESEIEAEIPGGATEEEKAGEIVQPDDTKEFFYRRAYEEVSSLQMVEHVISGVERDQMKIIPKTFDDLGVKTALHKFKQVSEETDSPEHSQAEFGLMQETENWYSVLSQRDKNITVAQLRRFCETTRPPLSSQALLALARFYRNAPYSENVRAKFDLIITRLLSRETSGDMRQLVFNREEIIKHLEGLYAEWSSISLYSPDKDDSNILLAALKFQDFMSEADEARSFDDLIKSDFFNRLRAVKESASENFFAPMVTTSAIECNIKVGNRYVELLKAERADPEILMKKYGVLHEEAISDIAGKTLHLAQLLSEKNEPEETEAPAPQKIEEAPAAKEKAAKPKKEKSKTKGKFAVNKWLLIIFAAVVFGNVCLFLFSGDSVSGNQAQTVVPDKVNLENSVLKEHLKSARMSNGIFYGRIAPSWNDLTQEQREAFLQKALNAGKDRGYTTVHFLNDEGRPIAYAKGDRIEINQSPAAQ